LDKTAISRVILTENNVCVNKNKFSPSEDRNVYELMDKTNYGECDSLFDLKYDTRVT